MRRTVIPGALLGRIITRAAAVTAPPAMQRKAIRRAIVAVLSASVLPVAALDRLGLPLAAGNKRRQPVDVALAFLWWLLLLQPRLKVLRLWLLLRLEMLRLMLLFARIEGLGLRRIGLADLRLFVAVVVAVIGGTGAARLLLEVGLGLSQLFLRGGNQAEIMLGMLIVILGGDRISGALRVTGKLEIFFRDVRGRATDFYVLAV